jgi:hypothetical protein
LSTSVSNPAAGVPEPVAHIRDVMSPYAAPWALCGGWAIDGWLGRQSREHGDVDIVVFVHDQRTLFHHLRGWQLVCHDARWPANNEPWDGGSLISPGHLHGRVDRGEAPAANGIMTAEDGFVLDIQLNECAGDRWTLSRDPLISAPLGDAITMSSWGIPTVVPEVLLFYKALDLRRRDKADFAALLPTLSDGQRGWLRDAVAAVGHPWTRELAAVAAS